MPGEGAFDFDDLTSAEESSAWKALHAEAHRRAWAVLEKFVRGEPNIDLAGCVISLPGSGGQKFHQDEFAQRLARRHVQRASVCACMFAQSRRCG